MSDYYILSLRWTRTNEECVTWWGHDNSGYVISLANAGRYSDERVRSMPGYYDNRENTVAVPCEVAEKHALRVVHADLLDKVVSEAIGARVHVRAPFEECTDDDGRPIECSECGHSPQHKGPSRLVMETGHSPERHPSGTTIPPETAPQVSSRCPDDPPDHA